MGYDTGPRWLNAGCSVLGPVGNYCDAQSRLRIAVARDYLPQYA
jgi:hypothetical protein